MREIKFRAWDGKKIRTDFYIDSVGDISQWDSKELNFVGNIKSLKLMQFTGLKDKNGVEIYEGDIVKYTHLNVRSSFTSTGRKTFGPWNNIEDKKIVSFSDDRCGFNVYKNTLEEPYEVIGNIYQNPELKD